MSSEHPSRPLPRHPRVFWSRLVWQWPLLVWIGMAVLAWWLYERGGDFMRINGMVEVTTESVSPLDTGRLISINVIPGQRVEAGEALAQLDTSLIDEQIAVVAQELQQDRANDERQFTVAKERILDELRGFTIDADEARSGIEIYQQEIARLEPLVDSGMIDLADLAEMKVRVAAYRASLLHIGEFQKHLQEQLAKLEESERGTLAYYDAQESGEAGSSELSVLRKRKADLTLRAQQAGVVSRIRVEPGEVVSDGERVIDIITERPRRILAFMNETDTRKVAVGDIVEVQPATGGKRFQARIVALSPNIISLEDRASPIPDRMVRGRRLELVPIEKVDLTPGAGMIVLLPTETRFQSFFGGGKE